MEESTLKQRKLMLTRILAFIGWIFIIAGLSSLGLTFVPSLRGIVSTPVPSSTPYASTVLQINAITQCPGCAGAILSLQVIITLPRGPVLYQSVPLIVSIVQTSPFTSFTPEPDQTQVPAQQVVVQVLPTLLGVRLSASAFDVDPQKQPPQRFVGDATELDFDWTMTPKYIGDQTLIIAITAPYPSAQQGEPPEQVLAAYTIHLTVGNIATPTPSGKPAQPEKALPNSSPLLSLGQELLVALLGSVLNIPWIVGLLQKRKEAKEKKPPT